MTCKMITYFNLLKKLKWNKRYRTVVSDSNNKDSSILILIKYLENLVITLIVTVAFSYFNFN